ncbi:MAG TPA: hypothetical protein VI912_01330 [Candidatus Bilamarchaeaceae archaeon]|nr:hypothetical protein [Candidatus Bilamarchaeaceae archaeon]
MSLFVNILRVFGSLVSAIGGVLVFFGAIGETAELILFGLFFVIITAAFDVLTVRYESTKKLERISNDLLHNVGSQFAFPVILLFLYLFSGSKSMLFLSLALGLLSFFKVVSTTVKVYLFENKLY